VDHIHVSEWAAQIGASSLPSEGLMTSRGSILYIVYRRSYMSWMLTAALAQPPRRLAGAPLDLQVGREFEESVRTIVGSLASRDHAFRSARRQPSHLALTLLCTYTYLRYLRPDVDMSTEAPAAGLVSRIATLA